VVRVDIPVEDLRPDFVRAALAGRVSGVPPSAALALISEAQLPGADPEATLREAIASSDLEPHVRVGAVRAYLRVAAEAAPGALAEFLQSDEERVAVAAAAALGQIGTPEHLSALRGMRRRVRADFARRRVAFAEALIVHRFGVTDHDVELPSAEVRADALQAVGALPFKSVRPGPERRKRALEGIRREFPTLDPAQQDVYELQCGPRLMQIAVALDVVGRDKGRAASRRPALPAIVAVQDPEYDEYNPVLVMLSRPARGNQVTLQLTRLGSGEPIYVGEGSVDRDEPVFDLRATNTPGITPMSARVRLTDAGIEITGMSEARAVPARVPEQIESPDTAGPQRGRRSART